VIAVTYSHWADVRDSGSSGKRESVVLESSGQSAGKNSLTKREADVVRLVSQGLANKAVARELGIEEGTVKIHLHNTYRKLGIQNRFALLRIAIDNRGE
jgi:DNA-binding NarL/FixJ family response regulator